MLIEKPGSYVGGLLLVGGSCIGAGMLALPILTGIAGFFPSFIMFICAWAFMKVTALLLLEVSGWFKQGANITTIAEHMLGKFGKVLCGTIYLFLFYSLLIAYISGSGSLGSTYFSVLFASQIPAWSGSLVFAGLCGFVVYLGTQHVDYWNRVLMFGKIFTYLALVFLGARYVQFDKLMRSDPQYALFSLPVLIVSFGYHNMIPTLMSYMKGNIKRVRSVLFSGSLFALVIYLIWEVIVLGIVPVEGEWGLAKSLTLGRQASDAIAGILGVSWVSTFAEGLAFFSLLTSFLAQTLALVHFLTDALKVQRKKHENLSICFLTLFPPLFFSLLYPHLFIKALNFAGGICAVVLFGILPITLAWIGRYYKKQTSSYRVFGGKPLLIIAMLFAFFIFFFQLSQTFFSHP